MGTLVGHKGEERRDDQGEAKDEGGEKVTERLPRSSGEDEERRRRRGGQDVLNALQLKGPEGGKAEVQLDEGEEVSG